MGLLDTLTKKLTEEQPRLDLLDLYWEGKQPTAFMSPKSREEVGSRLHSLGVNYPRLCVTAKADRLRLTGFRFGSDPSTPADPEFWKLWKKNGMLEGGPEAIQDALVYGRGYVVVWTGPRGVQISVESPRQMTVLRDPATREITEGLKRWKADGYGWAIHFTGKSITTYRTKNKVGDGWDNVNAADWVQQGKALANPLGVPPIGQVLNRGRLLDFDGVSEMDNVMGLTDALNKLLQDGMVTSEGYARPKRWATGLTIEVDEEGNPVNPFKGPIWQAEGEGKFGQFDQANMGGYEQMATLIINQIGAVKGLPAHYLGLNNDQPPGADAIRASESSLVSAANATIRMFSRDFEWIAALVIAVRDGKDPYDVEVEAIWASPETRTQGQASDAAAKLSGIGVPLETLLADELGYDPTRVAKIMRLRRGEAIQKAATSLTGGAVVTPLTTPTTETLTA